MGAILVVKKINIKASNRNYEVSFINNSKKFLPDLIKKSDFLIIDDFFLKKKNFKDLIKIDKNNIIAIKANEKSK